MPNLEVMQVAKVSDGEEVELSFSLLGENFVCVCTAWLVQNTFPCCYIPLTREQLN